VLPNISRRTVKLLRLPKQCGVSFKLFVQWQWYTRKDVCVLFLLEWAYLNERSEHEGVANIPFGKLFAVQSFKHRPVPFPEVLANCEKASVHASG